MQGFRPKSPPYEGPVDFEPYPVGYVELPGEVKVESLLVDVAAEHLRDRHGDGVGDHSVRVHRDGRALVTFAFRPTPAQRSVGRRGGAPDRRLPGVRGQVPRLRLRPPRAAEASRRGRAHPGPGRSALRRLEAITAADFLVTYTCDVRPSTEEQQAIRDWVNRGGRWLALHGTNCTLDPPTGSDGGLYSAPRVFPVWADTLGSQFVSHPPIEPYVVTRSPGAATDPLVAGIEPFEANDELYLMEHHGDLIPLLETRWTGSTRGFAEADWPDDTPRLVLYRRPLGRRRGRVLHARPLPQPLGHDPPAPQRSSLADGRTRFMERARVHGDPSPRRGVGEGVGGSTRPQIALKLGGPVVMTEPSG